MANHIDVIKKQFTTQAESFNEYQRTYSREEYYQELLNKLNLKKEERILDVAAGTCGFGRSLAPLCKSIVEFDAVSGNAGCWKKRE